MTEDRLSRFLSSRSSVYLSKIEDMVGEDTADEYDEGEDDEIQVHLIELGSEDEKEAVREGKMIVKAFYLSFFLLSIVALIGGLVAPINKGSFVIGWFTGFATGVFYICHLNASVRDILNCDEASAKVSMRRDSTIRIAVVGFTGIAVAGLVGKSSIIGVLAQMMLLKLSVYLSPFMAKILKLIFKNVTKGG